MSATPGPLERVRPALGWRVALVPLATAAALHLPGLLRGDWYLFRDAAVYGYPNEQVLREALRAGALPHLNPLVQGGIPHLADPATLCLYPPAWVAALPAPLAGNLFVLLHAILAGVGAARLARGLGAGPRGQALAGGAFVTSGYLLSFQESAPLLAGTSWLPWVLALALRLGRAPSGAAAPLVGLALGTALLGLANAPLAAQGVLVGAGLLLLGGGPARAAARCGRLAAWGGLSGLLVAAQLLPASAWLPLTARRQDGYELALAGQWSTSPWRVLEAWVPWPFGSPFPDAHGFWGQALLPGGRPHFLADTLYVGPLVLALGLLGLPAQRRRAAGPLLLLTGAALLAGLLALGARTPLFALARALPGAGGFRYPEKLLVWPTLLACVLAGRGLTRLAGGPLPRAAVWAPALGGALLLLGRGPLGARVGALVGEAARPALLARLDQGTVRAALLLGLLTWALARGRRGRLALAPALVGALALADPLSVNAARSFRGACPFPPAPDTVRCAAAALNGGRLAVRPVPPRAAPGPDSARRYLERQQARRLDAHRWYGLPRADGFASWRSRRLSALQARDRELAERLLAVQVRAERQETPPTPGDERLQSFPDLGLQLVRPAHRLPWAWLVPAARTRGVADDEQALAAVTAAGFAPGEEAVLTGWRGAASPDQLAPTAWAPNDEPPAMRREGAALVFDLELGAPGTLLVSQLFGPGWQAEVDGARARLYPAQALILGLPLEAGRHRVWLTPCTPRLLPGLLGSGLGLLLCAALLARDLRARGR